MTQPDSTTLDADETGDRKVSLMQVVAIVLCFILYMLDGMDVLVVSYAAPQIIDEWDIQAQTFGYILSAGLVGMTIGSAFLTPLADIIGRRRVILFSVMIIALSMILTSMAENYIQLLLLRVIVGLGIGVSGATLAAIAAEYAPDRYRDLAVTSVAAGYSVGAVLTGLVAAWIIPEFGWRVMFMVAGVATLIMFPLALALLPESVEFLLRKQPSGALDQINRINRRTGRSLLARLPDVDRERQARPGVRSLLIARYRRSTLAIWVAFCMIYLTVYFLIGWVPKIVVDAGLALDQAIYAGTTLNLGGVVGMVLIGALGARFKIISLVVLFQFITCALMLAFGYLTVPLVILLVIAGLLGFFSYGGLVGLMAATARIYPTEIRASGVGWGLAAGRFGGIIGLPVGGILISLEWSRAMYFTFFAVPCVIAAFAVMAIVFEAEKK